MPSSSPGMDPYLEQDDVWEGFHGRFIPVAAEDIGAQVQPAYIVKMGMNVNVHEPEDDRRVLLGKPDYYAIVARAEEHPAVAVRPIGLRDALPTIPIPLRPPDGDAALDLQAVLNRVYDAAGYRQYIYDAVPQSRLPDADRKWAEQLARAT